MMSGTRRHAIPRAPEIVDEVVRSPGHPLDASVRTRLEPWFGQDFSHVRVHTDGVAAASAQAVGANAYTVGHHIVFNTGRYDSTSSEGNRLLAHELTHVVQQRDLLPQAGLVVAGADHSSEQQADAIASVVGDETVAVGRTSDGVHVHGASRQAQVSRRPSDEWGSAYGGKEPQEFQSYKTTGDPLTRSSESRGTRRATIDSVNAVVIDKPGPEGVPKYWPAFGQVVLVGPPHDNYAPVVSYPGGKPHGYVALSIIKIPTKPSPVTSQDLDFIDPKWKQKAFGRIPRKGKSAADIAAAELDVTEKILGGGGKMGYLNQLNEALDLMQIDTIEARANFIANTLVESAGLSQFTEAQFKSQVFEEDPTRLTGIDLEYYNRMYPVGSEKRRTINPDESSWAFRGRGAVQVTHRHIYIRVIAFLEKQAEHYQAQGNKDAANRCKEAADAIKRDPREAARPKFAFLFSAAYMKMMKGDLAGRGLGWMGAQPRATEKNTFFDRAVITLSR